MVANSRIRPALQVFDDITAEAIINTTNPRLTKTAIEHWLKHDEEGNLIEAVTDYFGEVEDRLIQSRQIAEDIMYLQPAAMNNKGNDGRIPQGRPSGNDDQLPPGRPIGNDGQLPPGRPSGSDDQIPPGRPSGDEDQVPPG